MQILAMIKLFKYIVAFSVLAGFTAHAQSSSATRAVAMINASATVVGNLDLVVVRDLVFEISSLSPSNLVVDPQKNPDAGEIQIVGSPNSLVRLTFETQSILRHESGQSILYFTNNLSGNSSETQGQSVLITHDNQVRLNDQGIYYLWVGGRLTGVEDIMPGQYNMDFTMQLDYIQ